ncbi:nuclear transport factor 2 family protein [Sphingopyxis sp.]|uniref:YybH family protein n=1 Tax=Sphingopyxis sp. TaxID=1908224 RepID=UPI0025DC9A4B|nr:nuclear transport factor 2 family protein [Sphingopyxis sp.]MBR2172919.1 nuclear transport factor 2 family protein [Sphingopyxis sp.]
MRRLTITAITLAMLVAVPAQATEPVDYQGAAAALAQYKSAMEKRDLTGVEALFSPDAQIFESGGVEGNFAHYRDHHLGPELKEFKSFTFRNYKISVRGEGDVAIATETYSFSIVLGSGETIERDGVATSVLKRENGKWQIVNLHSSSRKPKVRPAGGA